MVQTKDLKDFILDKVKYPEPFLYCPICKGRYSANKGDYWYCPEDFIFKCCNTYLVLAKEETKIIILKD